MFLIWRAEIREACEVYIADIGNGVRFEITPDGARDKFDLYIVNYHCRRYLGSVQSIDAAQYRAQDYARMFAIAFSKDPLSLEQGHERENRGATPESLYHRAQEVRFRFGGPTIVRKRRIWEAKQYNEE